MTFADPHKQAGLNIMFCVRNFLGQIMVNCMQLLCALSYLHNSAFIQISYNDVCSACNWFSRQVMTLTTYHWKGQTGTSPSLSTGFFFFFCSVTQHNMWLRAVHNFQIRIYPFHCVRLQLVWEELLSMTPLSSWNLSWNVIHFLFSHLLRNGTVSHFNMKLVFSSQFQPWAIAVFQMCSSYRIFGRALCWFEMRLSLWNPVA